MTSTEQTGPRIMGLQNAPKTTAIVHHDGRSYQWLQYVGYVQAKPVEDLEPGEFRIYNFGSTAEILRVEKTGKTWALTVRTAKGDEYTRKHRAGTLIAYGTA